MTEGLAINFLKWLPKQGTDLSRLESNKSDGLWPKRCHKSHARVSSSRVFFFCEFWPQTRGGIEVRAYTRV